jgi:hypothetical protein
LSSAVALNTFIIHKTYIAGIPDMCRAKWNG